MLVRSKLLTCQNLARSWNQFFVYNFSFDPLSWGIDGSTFFGVGKVKMISLPRSGEILTTIFVDNFFFDPPTLRGWGVWVGHFWQHFFLNLLQRVDGGLRGNQKIGVGQVKMVSLARSGKIFNKIFKLKQKMTKGGGMGGWSGDPYFLVFTNFI